jgi:predicted metal-binding membrane protein
MATSLPAALRRQRDLILALLVVLSVGAWALLIWQANRTGHMAGLAMGMRATLFVALWVAMMVAMMFPTAAPMILMFARVHAGRRDRGQTFVPTWVFVGAYLLIWTLFGVLAYVVAITAAALGSGDTWLMDNGPRLGGGLLILAGLYQLTPLKRVCLAKCRTPLAFIMTSWRDGYAGALRMGLSHGAYCLGCCWLLFVILFPLGMMNIAVLGIITFLIFAEKSLPIGLRLSQVAAVALITYGVVVVFFPDALPTMAPHNAHMKM